jgi:hypothetical protein
MGFAMLCVLQNVLDFFPLIGRPYQSLDAGSVEPGQPCHLLSRQFSASDLEFDNDGFAEPYHKQIGPTCRIILARCPIAALRHRWAEVCDFPSVKLGQLGDLPHELRFRDGRFSFRHGHSQFGSLE